MARAVSPETKMNPWVNAMRPHTLPLGLASVLLGILLAIANDVIDWPVALLCVVTATLLQILSNLANDYGDFLHGADKTGRQGPRRAVASGDITPGQMRLAIGVTVVLSLVSGVALLILSVRDNPAVLLLFVGLGALAVVAALTYTLGKRPYGYAGLGDLAVLIFFGWAGGIGTYYLQAGRLDWAVILPATSTGLLAVGVLNLNNLRDLDSDRAAGKRSIPVRLGAAGAIRYHAVLLAGALLLSVVYVLVDYQGIMQFAFVLMTPLLVQHWQTVRRARTPLELVPPLKRLSLLTLLYALLFGIGQMLA